MHCSVGRFVASGWVLLSLCCWGTGCSPRATTGGDPAVRVASGGVASAQPPSPLADDELRRDLDHALDFTFHKRHLNLRDHAAWQIVHGVVSFEREYQVERQRDGELVNVIEHLLNGGQMRGWTFEPGLVLDEKTGRRGLKAIVEQGSKTGQGHPDQWLGYLSSCGLLPAQTVKYGDATYTVADWITQMEWDAPQNPQREYSWTLMALSHYRPMDYKWIASDGQEWTVEKLVQIEAEHDLGASACGGSHRLAGLTMAVNRHLADGGKADSGGWKAAKDKIDDSVRKARQFQNPDGSLSTNYFVRPGTSADAQERLGTTGHAFEFVVLAVDGKEFDQPWIHRAASALCELFEKTEKVSLECGALYHATHGLLLYRERLFGKRSFLTTPAPGETADQANSIQRP